MKVHETKIDIYTPLTAEQMAEMARIGSFLEWNFLCCDKKQHEECMETGKCAFAIMHMMKGGHYGSPSWLYKNCECVKLRLYFCDTIERVCADGKRHTAKTARPKK